MIGGTGADYELQQEPGPDPDVSEDRLPCDLGAAADPSELHRQRLDDQRARADHGGCRGSVPGHAARLRAGEGSDQVSAFDLIGYSLGGAQAAFVAKLDDDEQRAFGFQRVLLINPPVNLASSARNLDALLENNTPQGLGVFNQMISRFIGTVVQQGTPSFSPDLLYTPYQHGEPKDESLEVTIGLVFRVVSADMTFTTELMTDLRLHHTAPPAAHRHRFPNALCRGRAAHQFR